MDEQIKQNLPVSKFETLSITHLKIIYCLLCFPSIKPGEIAYLLAVPVASIYKELQNINEKLGIVPRNLLLKKMHALGFFDLFF